MNSVFGVIFSQTVNFASICLVHQLFQKLFVIFGPFADRKFFDVNDSFSFFVELYHSFYFIAGISFYVYLTSKSFEKWFEGGEILIVS